MTLTAPPICYSCSRLQEPDRSEDLYARPTCAAFPDGIPDVIWLEHADHRQPVSGDNGIRFEQDPEGEPPDDEWYDPPLTLGAVQTP